MGLFGRKPKKLGEILIEKGLASREDVAEALKIQKELKGTKKIQKRVGDILSDKGVITLEDLHFALAEQKRVEGFIIKGMLDSAWRR
jgi:hypothetical protein